MSWLNNNTSCYTVDGFDCRKVALCDFASGFSSRFLLWFVPSKPTHHFRCLFQEDKKRVHRRKERSVWNATPLRSERSQFVQPILEPHQPSVVWPASIEPTDSTTCPL